MPLNLGGENVVGWARPERCPKDIETISVVTGRSTPTLPGIEVAVARWSGSGQPSRDALTRLHARRVNERVTPVILAIEIHRNSVIIFGPDTSVSPSQPIALEQAERQLQVVLDASNQLDARRQLAAFMVAAESVSTPGLTNSGLFASHELRFGVPQRADWHDACRKSSAWLGEKDFELIECLGFKGKSAGPFALVLEDASRHPEAIAVMLDEGETFDTGSARFSISPVAYGLKMAAEKRVPWLILTKGHRIRLYPARIDLGVGRKGLAETFFELDLPLLTVETSGYLSLVFSAEALAEGGSAFEIMAASAQYGVALGSRLRDRVYKEIVPVLSVAVAQQLREQGHEMDSKGLDLAYQLTLRIFFRMLFQTYAEDRKLLPFGENQRYDRNALKTVARDFMEDSDQDFDAESTSFWDDLTQVWHVIDKGDRAWGVPAYNGGLFSTDEELHPYGALIDRLHITNDVIGPCLKALLLDRSDDGEYGPVDFRSLSVREFGTIYEGLLESSLGLAEIDLTLDASEAWVPAGKDDVVVAPAGAVYFHNTSGQRKATGSFYTPTFVVEHLLERSLDPAIDDHLGRVAELLKNGDQATAAEIFFDFRVADLAMGSGHFLTAAIDHIEAKMASFLEEDGHSIPGVTRELMQLEQAAVDAMGPDSIKPERSSLLRRQIARRCIYGLDINPISVELARVSIWIHTFVRGLPMSSLDHSLVCANSLTGIGSIAEALDVLVPNPLEVTFWEAEINEALESSKSVLLDVALLAEVDRKETQTTSRAVRKALEEARVAKLIFDGAVLKRIGRTDLVRGEDVDVIVAEAGGEPAENILRDLSPGHMPVLFPEVFLRERGGFDVLVGNPPWEKLHVEEHQWWGLRLPGLRSLAVAERAKRIAELGATRPELMVEYQRDIEVADAARAAISSGPYPGIGSGHVDLYKAFAWRNWQLLRDSGRFGVVMPRGALSGSGTEKWRREILKSGEFTNVVVGTNSAGWMFENVHPQYSVALIVGRKGAGDAMVNFAGSFYSYEEFIEGRDALASVPTGEFLTWTDTAAFPLLPDETSGQVFRQMRHAPGLHESGSFGFRPVQGDLNATSNRALFSTDLSSGRGDLPILTGSSFYLWSPDMGSAYGMGDDSTRSYILEKTLNSARQKRSAFFGMKISGLEDLPMSRARIAFRDVTNPTNTRTMVCCLVPPEVSLVHQAPYLVTPRGSEQQEAFLLGVLSSIPADWYLRKLVELHMTFEILKRLPVPEFQLDDSRVEAVIHVAGRLAASDSRFEPWAAAVGVPVGSVKSDLEKEQLEAELDALVAHLYGLSREQLVHIFKTFHRGWNFGPRLEAVLTHFDAIEGR